MMDHNILRSEIGQIQLLGRNGLKVEHIKMNRESEEIADQSVLRLTLGSSMIG